MQDLYSDNHHLEFVCKWMVWGLKLAKVAKMAFVKGSCSTCCAFRIIKSKKFSSGFVEDSKIETRQRPVTRHSKHSPAPTSNSFSALQFLNRVSITSSNVEMGARIGGGSSEGEIDDITCWGWGAMLGPKGEDELELAWAYMTTPGIAESISY